MIKAHDSADSLVAMAVLFCLVGTAFPLVDTIVQAAPANSRWRENYFPNVRLVTQNGKTIHFYDDLIKDKVVAINFIYTHCQDSCPVETANLKQVQKLLGDRVGNDIFFYSISIDPEDDTPQVLKEYSDKFKVGPGWTFLTGNEKDIALLREKLGLHRAGPQEENLNEHNISLIVGNEKTGQWMKRSAFDNPKVLARLLGKTLSNFSSYRPEQASYAAATRLPAISRGEDIFRSRCRSCHSLSEEDGIGPGLSAVTEKRDRAWLIRWMKAPDRVLARKDPVALQLFTQYKELPMPNLRLSDTDVEALIKYLKNYSISSQQLQRVHPIYPLASA